MSKILKTRRKFLIHAIDYVFGEKLISGRDAADLYANLLGFENNNNLNYLIKSNKIAVTAISHDWDSLDDDALSIFKQYLPKIESRQLLEVDRLSQPNFSLADSVWRPRLISLLKGVTNLLELRYGTKSKVSSELAVLLISLADRQIYNDKARNRLFIICSVLVHFVVTKKISAIRWLDIAVLYQPQSFNFLIDHIYGYQEKFISDSYVLKEVLRYADKDCSVFFNHDSAFEVFQNLFVELGVDNTACELSNDVGKAIFGDFGNIGAYKARYKSDMDDILLLARGIR
ncbi:hypothetical protein C9J12_26850 [Photobacterium frigidiphilum]|uniref:Uncharacterized protein n=1 Tax=Photobacterium frigidiphilum TaxID=264736 RepID=A0A2T3J727_9GAMM|nr:hypothetical protein [Photobacterium frigidiphilum]PSU44564.1 hypothetical protein C9J12_26850 [Photobacterium frigidiphilum]